MEARRTTNSSINPFSSHFRRKVKSEVEYGSIYSCIVYIIFLFALITNFIFSGESTAERPS